MKKVVFFALVCLFLVACQNQEEVSQTPFPENTPTWTFSATPSITSAVSQTPDISSVKVLNLPAWLKDPETNVLMYRLWDSAYSPIEGGDHILPVIYFLNAETGAQFSIDSPFRSNVASVRWYDNQHAVFQSEQDALYLLDLFDSTLLCIPSTDPSFSTYARVPPIWDPGDTIEWAVDENTGNQIVIVTEKNTVQQRIFDNGNLISVDVVISEDGKYLANLSTPGDDIFWGDHITLYNFLDQSVIMMIDDHNINKLSFYPEEGWLIYMRGREMPCVVDILSQEKKCIQTIHSAYPDAFIYFRGLTSDHKTLLFLHAELDSGARNGGLCFYDLATGILNCPMDGLSILADHAVTDFSLSPDEQYIAAIYEEYHPYADVSSPTGSFIKKRWLELCQPRSTDLGTSYDISCG